MGTSIVSYVLLFFQRNGSQNTTSGFVKVTVGSMNTEVPRTDWTGCFGIIAGLDGQFGNPGKDPVHQTCKDVNHRPYINLYV